MPLRSRSLFVQGGATDFLYGAGIQVDPSTGDVLASFTGVSWGDNKKQTRSVRR